MLGSYAMHNGSEGDNRSGVIEIDGTPHIILDEHTRLIKVAPNKELYKRGTPKY